VTSFVVLAVALSAFVGAAIGSFLNVVVYRVPRGESVVSPRSACPRCGHTIRSVDNVPVLSWMLLRGRCRDCAAPISVRYPVVELGTAVFFALVAWWLVSGYVASGDLRTSAAIAALLALVAYLYLAAISVALTLIDLDTHTLPNKIVLPAYAVGIALLGASALFAADYGRLLSAGVGMASLWLLYLAAALLYPGGMGLGDVKLAGVLGLFLGWLGWGSLFVGAFAAFILGGVFALVLLATKRVTRKGGIPFGPWMLAGAWVGILAGESVWRWYLALFGLA
jgi:leader peptidase (prepilin peptidase)/N-methyltransferase